MSEQKNIPVPVYDVRPTSQFELASITQKEIDLRALKRGASKGGAIALDIRAPQKRVSLEKLIETETPLVTEANVEPQPVSVPVFQALEIEYTPTVLLTNEINHAEFATFWANGRFQSQDKIVQSRTLPSSAQFSLAGRTIPASELERAESIRNKFSVPVAAIISTALVEQPKEVLAAKPVVVKKKRSRKRFWWTIGSIFFLFIATIGLLAYGAVTQGKRLITDEVLLQGSEAVVSLQQAKQSLEAFRFEEAAGHFTVAKNHFASASGTLTQLTASLFSTFNTLPVLQKARSINSLLEAGTLFAKAGEDLSTALARIVKLNYPAMLRPESAETTEPLSAPLKEFRQALVSANKNVKKASRLIDSIDTDLIPADKLATLNDFKAKLPEFERYSQAGLQYSDFLLRLVADGGTKSYLVLFTNNTELRPGGGFPGSYALITFDHGYLKKVFVDDIYNIDGQVRKNIVPPIPLQHITPNWAMRDANWFADYPQTAQKVEEFYVNNGGSQVDGVITLTPTIIERILAITGPIDMPEYGVKLSAENFIAEIQEEVEYRADRAQPKRILMDFEPKLYRALATLPNDKLLKVLSIALDAAQERHIMAYFNDPELQKMVVENDIAGTLKRNNGDFLMIAYSNVKGSKSDAVTFNHAWLQTTFESGQAQHSLTINRNNTGGKSAYKFYNKENASYVRVYLPRSAVITWAEGQSRTDYKPLINHRDLGYKVDPDLEAIENSIYHPFPDIDVFEEAQKKVVGFWLVTKPQQTSSFVLKYSIPDESVDENHYVLDWQKQPGTIEDGITLTVRPPAGKIISSYNVPAKLGERDLVYESNLRQDQSIKVDFK